MDPAMSAGLSKIPADTQKETRPLENWEMYQAWNGSLSQSVPQNRHDYTTPTIYPSIDEARFNYELTSPGAVVDQHIIRHAQQAMWMGVVMYPEYDSKDVLTDKMRGIFNHAEERLPGLEMRIAEAEKGKDEANKLHLAGKHQQATVAYCRAWGNVLPWYPEALPRDDPRRQKLGSLVAIIFANLSAASVALAANTKPAPHPQMLKVYRQQAFKNAWIALEQREYAKVSTVKNACLRVAEYVKYLHREDQTGGSAAFKAAAKTVSAYCKKQAAALGGVPKDMLFKDVEPERVVPRPEPIVLLLVGPQAWNDDLRSLGEMAANRNTVVGVKTRPLTFEELWAGHDHLTGSAAHSPDDDVIPDEYPDLRSTFCIQSPAQDFNLHCLRQMKLYIVESFWRTRAHDDTGDEFYEHMRERRARPFTKQLLPGMIDDAEAVLDGVYSVMKGDPTRMIAAPGLLADCYISLLPAHVDAFASDDPIRARLGQVDTTIWSEMAYCASALGVQREEATLPGTKVLFQQAARCAWLVLIQRWHANVGAIRSACGISLLMDEKDVWRGCDHAQLSAMQLYWERQLVALDGVDDKVWFQDLDNVKRIQMPNIQRERGSSDKAMWVCAWDEGVEQHWQFVGRK